ncbi:27172_t:CDS:2 [Gigaspora margarita]|uniref:27172_t:CDS:1 n=1 Tax=Gigaspora margarita TaxID=4874 RepID=A0ABM8VWM6_GIGMA|nr:27172_t:CDS:2 [Gigaspora margarita]
MIANKIQTIKPLVVVYGDSDLEDKYRMFNRAIENRYLSDRLQHTPNIR